MTDAPERVAVRCLQARHGLSEEQALARIRAQLTAEERGRYAQVIIDTDCSLDELRDKVKQLWQAVQRDPAQIPARV